MLSQLDPYLTWHVAGLLLAAAGLLGIAVSALSSMHRTHHATRIWRLESNLVQMRLERARLLNLQEERQLVHNWNGLRMFHVSAKTREAQGTWSLRLEPHDGKPVPPFLAGQYLTVSVQLPGETQRITRCYTISSDQEQLDHYRITVKRITIDDNATPPVEGRVSSYLTRDVQPGSILHLKPPAGHFTIDMNHNRPLVLIAGGIGITPQLAKLYQLRAAPDEREVWLFLGFRNGREHPFKEEMTQLLQEMQRLRIHICYSQPDEADEKGRDYHEKGRLSTDVLRGILPSNNFEFHICGPGAMMQQMTDGLKAWGVPNEHTHFEAFGPSSVRKVAPTGPQKTEPGKEAKSWKVTFAHSNKTVIWNADTGGSLLELAEQNGIAIESGCRSGSCGTCDIAIKSGTISNIQTPDKGEEAPNCLACVSLPHTDLEVDA